MNHAPLYSCIVSSHMKSEHGQVSHIRQRVIDKHDVKRGLVKPLRSGPYYLGDWCPWSKEPGLTTEWWEARHSGGLKAVLDSAALSQTPSWIQSYKWSELHHTETPRWAPSTHEVKRNNCYYFTLLSLEMVCYTAMDDWYIALQDSHIYWRRDT